MIGGLSWESSSSSLAESVSVAPISVTSVSVTPGVLSVELLAEGGWPQ